MQIQPNQLCHRAPTTPTHTGSIYIMVIHSSRALLKHIWSQSKERDDPETFSRSLTSGFARSKHVLYPTTHNLPDVS